MTEAEEVWITTHDGRVVAAHALAYDQETGFGLVQALGALDLPALELGSSADARLGDAVIFADADEFIVPDPTRYDGLRDYAAANSQRRAVGVTCLNVIHHLASEKPLDLAQPVLGQRQMAKFLPLFCKPSLKFVDNPWAASSHGIRGVDFEIDPDLVMFHLKFADRDHLQQVADQRRAFVESDGRSASTNWSRGGDDLVALLEQITSDVDTAAVADFVPPQGQRLADLVVEEKPGHFRARKGSQVRLMENRPLVAIPERFHGRV